MRRKLLTVLYAHPEAYPPTLNALTELSRTFEQISILYRPLLPVEWEYSDNVVLYPSGKQMNVRVQEALPLLKRIRLFLDFTIRFYKLCKKEKPDVILLYDALPVLAYSIIRRMGLSKHIVWYHNHDVLEPGQKKYSLNWWAYRAERNMFPLLDIFSLPAQERRQYFPMEQFKGNYFFLPNQPAVSFYRQYQSIVKDDKTWRIIYQGHIDRGHGIEEILGLMPRTVNGRPLHLVLKGWIRDEYKVALRKIIDERGLQAHVEFAGYTAYQELPKLTASCHIGIAIHTKTDVMNKTLGTASNKIYEYAAVGLPVLYYDNVHFNRHLREFDWAVSTTASSSSLIEALEHITANYPVLSASAEESFMDRLNYEHHFRNVEHYLEDLSASPTEKLVTAT